MTVVDAAPVRILVVCTGNVCRSPVADLLLATAATDAGLAAAVSVGSAGTDPYPGSHISPESGVIAGEHGVDQAAIDAHRAARLTVADLRESDLVLVATRQHRQVVARMLPKVARNLYTIREFGRLAELALGEGAEVIAAPTMRTGSDDVRAAVRAIAAKRGYFAGTVDAADDDIIDPIGRGWDAYRRMESELVPATTVAARYLFATA